jgi:hypothetical protein
MKPTYSLPSLLLLAAFMLPGCGSSETAPTEATREEAIEMHRATANREMQDIQRSRAEHSANK